MVLFQFKSEIWEPEQLMGSSTLKADRLKSHKEPVFPFKSEDWQQLTSQFEGDQAEEVPLTLGKVNFLLFTHQLTQC